MNPARLILPAALLVSILRHMHLKKNNLSESLRYKAVCLKL